MNIIPMIKLSSLAFNPVLAMTKLALFVANNFVPVAIVSLVIIGLFSLNKMFYKSDIGGLYDTHEGEFGTSSKDLNTSTSAYIVDVSTGLYPDLSGISGNNGY
jgi:hypothetical protein